MCNSIRSTILTWLLISLLLTGCAAYQPAALEVAQGSPLDLRECVDVIKTVARGGDDTILLQRQGSYIFGQMTREGWRMVLAQPKNSGELISATGGMNYRAFLAALKETGWEKVAPGLAAGIIRAVLGVMGDFIIIPVGIFRYQAVQG